MSRLKKGQVAGQTEFDPAEIIEVGPDEYEETISKHPRQESLDNPRGYTPDVRMFMRRDKLAGYALKDLGDGAKDLKWVFSFQPGLGAHAVKHAIQQGATHLDAFDGHLPKYYSQFGFHEYRREPNWTEGGPDVVFMKLPHAKALLANPPEPAAKSEQLEKRSKNVREQTRNLTVAQIRARAHAYIKRLGFRAEAGRQDRFGIGPDQRGLQYNQNIGDQSEHELAHALMTPTGTSLRDHQRALGGPSAKSPSMPERERLHQEAAAFEMEPMLARRAGYRVGRTGGVLSPDSSNAGRASARQELSAFEEDRKVLTPKGRMVPGTSVNAKINQRAAITKKSEYTIPEVLGAIHSTLKKMLGQTYAPHPHAYEWHDGHTDHHAVILKAQPEHPHMDGPPTLENDQVARPGQALEYRKYAMPYGNVNPDNRDALLHYPYQGKGHEIQRLVKDHGYQVYIAGGKYGKPDLDKRNYNTGHLMIYDPTPGSGGDSGVEEHTTNWRSVHELAHALVYPELNKIYGEGRRIGKLGHHRTMREALRAVHWEWLAAHKQRELSKQIGVEIPDDVFNKEVNTVMHDAIHRAVTGKFTEPVHEGFRPFSHKVPLETALSMVREAAHNLGLTGPHDLIRKSEEGKVAAEKEYTIPEVRKILADDLKGRIERYSKQLADLRKKELAKNYSNPAAYGPPQNAPTPGAMDQMAKEELCKECGKPHALGKCGEMKVVDKAEEDAGKRCSMRFGDEQCDNEAAPNDRLCAECRKEVGPKDSVKKNDELIDLKHASDQDKRLKPVASKKKVVLPGTKKSKQIVSAKDDGKVRSGKEKPKGLEIAAKAEPPMAKPPGKDPAGAAPTSKVGAPKLPKVPKPAAAAPAAPKAPVAKTAPAAPRIPGLGLGTKKALTAGGVGAAPAQKSEFVESNLKKALGTCPLCKRKDHNGDCTQS